MDENLMEFSGTENAENFPLDSSQLPLKNTPQFVKKSILKPSQGDNLIQLFTPVHKSLKVKFETPHTVKKSTPTRFEEIRKLDENECWIERTAVVTKQQHEENVAMATEWLSALIDNLPVWDNFLLSEEVMSLDDMDTEDFYDALDTPLELHPISKKETNQEVENELVSVENNSGTNEREENMITDHQQTEESSKENQDPFTTKSKVENSPMKSEEFNPFTTKSKVANSPVKSEEDDPFTTKSKVANSPIKSEELNPFTTKSKVVNSPVKVEEDNPFTTKSKVLNSPVKVEEDYPFTTKTKVANSPVKSEEFNPFTTVSKVANSPLQSEEVNPFATKSKIVNSPVKSEEIESIQTNANVSNSPVKSKEITTNTEVTNSPTISEKIDPFETNLKIVNSPAVSRKEKNPNETDSVGANSLTKLEENLDPFTTKSGENSGDVSTKSKVTCSQLNLEDLDPFAVKSNVKNSPSNTRGTLNAFAANSNVTNLKSELEDLDPFATKSKVLNSPLKLENQDPFATNSNVSNSPSQDTVNLNQSDKKSTNDTSSEELANPFATNSKVVNSPSVKPYENSVSQMSNSKSSDLTVEYEHDKQELQTKSNKTNSSIDQDKGVDPVQAKEIADKSNAPTSTKTGVQSANNDDPFKTPDFISGKKKMNGFVDMSEMGLSEDDFQPSSVNLFNDPSDLDVLEQLGSNRGITESSLARMSLYVKFDPLVDLPSADPRRASMDVRRMSRMYDPRLQQLECDESMLLLGTPPKNMNARRPPSVVKGQTPSGTKSTIHQKQMDLLCSSTPDSNENQTEVSGMTKEPLPFNNQGREDGIIEVLQYTEADIHRIKQNFALELQGILLDNQKEWSKKIQEKDQEITEKDEKLQKTEERCKKSEEDVKKMISVNKEYEAMINLLIAEKETAEEQVTEVKKELEKAKQQIKQEAQTIDTLDASFSNLHQRYEKLKEILGKAKENEDMLKSCIEQNQEKMKKSDEKLKQLKAIAEEKLKQAHDELEKKTSEHGAEMARIQAQIKLKDMQIERAEKALEQKTKENKELTEVCDQLMLKLES